MSKLSEKLHALRRAGHLTWDDVLQIEAWQAALPLAAYLLDQANGERAYDTEKKKLGGTRRAATRRQQATDNEKAIVDAACVIYKKNQRMTIAALAAKVELELQKSGFSLQNRRVRHYLQKNKKTWQQAS